MDIVEVTARRGLWVCAKPNEEKRFAVPKGTKLRLCGKSATTPDCEWEHIEVMEGLRKGRRGWVCKSESGKQYIRLVVTRIDPEPVVIERDSGHSELGYIAGAAAIVAAMIAVLIYALG